MSDDATRGTRAEPGAPTMDGDSRATTGLAEPPEDIGNDETMVPTWGASESVALPDPGYQIGELIGRGGMGEVVVAHDLRIGREVAVKRIRSHAPTHDAMTRFLREARIQARLDHPAIVPVYELGTDSEGRPYFTMKRLAGETLTKRLDSATSAQPLLRAFVDVCLAIQLAHSRGVVHRDLKPSNIMLGDYGEVYVLDWGVARVLTDRKRTTKPHVAVDVDEENTTSGSILGTPGYMAPEQVKGYEVGPPADVYALGAILFEILAGQPLHPRGEAALATTLSTPQSAPSSRAQRTPPPELDGACFEALAEDPDHRPSARELADRVQAYLDGDRDLERRRDLAAAQIQSARDALASEDPDARATAVRRAGRALALDPESTEAAELVTALMLEPPKVLPSELVESLDAEARAFNRQRTRAAFWACVSLFGFWAVIPFLSVKNWANLLSFYGLVTLGALLGWTASRTGRTRLSVTLVVMGALVFAFSRVAGPFALTPIVACAVLISATAIPEARGRAWLVVGGIVLAVSAPFILEGLGLIHSTYWLSGGLLVNESDMFQMRNIPLDRITLIVANILFVAITGALAYVLNTRRADAQRQLHIQAWHLRQLIPTKGSATRVRR